MKLLTLHAIHQETGQLLVCAIDLAKLQEADTLFRQFSRYVTHKGYILCKPQS